MLVHLKESFELILSLTFPALLQDIDLMGGKICDSVVGFCSYFCNWMRLAWNWQWKFILIKNPFPLKKTRRVHVTKFNIGLRVFKISVFEGAFFPIPSPTNYHKMKWIQRTHYKCFTYTHAFTFNCPCVGGLSHYPVLRSEDVCVSSQTTQCHYADMK